MIILTQTDTTVGFLSKSDKELIDAKKRAPTKPFLKNYEDFKSLKKYKRVYKNRKKLIRRAKKTTFVIKNEAFRVAKPITNSTFLRDYGWFYSTSANESQKGFDIIFAKEKSDIIIQNSFGLKETTPSKIYKINSKKIKRLR